MNNSSTPDFNFVKVLNEEKTYKLLFPEKGVGLAIVSIFEKIENQAFEDGKFTEKDLHESFERVNLTKERYPKEVYSEHIIIFRNIFWTMIKKLKIIFLKITHINLVIFPKNSYRNKCSFINFRIMKKVILVSHRSSRSCLHKNLVSRFQISAVSMG